ncbi:hypothetical protein FRC09_003138 [Ceratobasidium sp. 395]|nr:hypothetical protein FRC09_003138 [Ceratobasidium sp. 395]
MPSPDPDDQRDAREFERSLREDVLAGRADPTLLECFVALPKRVRRSLKLIVESAKRDQAALERRSTDRESSEQGGPKLTAPTNSPLSYMELNPWTEPNPWAESRTEPRHTGAISATTPPRAQPPAV